MSIEYERHGTTAIITMNRPAKLNALSLSMYEDLGHAFHEARDDDAVAAVILTGTGERAFCVGADLNESLPALTGGQFGIDRWDAAHQKHTTLFKPVIAAINGLALGGGFELMLSTDLRVAVDSASFALPEPKVGVVPAGGTLARLTRQISYAHAMEMLLLAEPIDAADALRYGLLNRVVLSSQDLMTVATEWADRIANLSGTALAVIKHAVLTLPDMSLDAAFRTEALYGDKVFKDPDAQAGLQAFYESRSPDFPSRRSSNTVIKNKPTRTR